MAQNNTPPSSVPAGAPRRNWLVVILLIESLCLLLALLVAKDSWNAATKLEQVLADAKSHCLYLQGPEHAL